MRTRWPWRIVLVLIIGSVPCWVMGQEQAPPSPFIEELDSTTENAAVPDAPEPVEDQATPREFFDSLEGSEVGRLPECGDFGGCLNDDACDAATCGAAPCQAACLARPCWGVEFGGWLAQGVTLNGRNPQDRFNGPVTFNDREGEYQLNQFWLYAEKAADSHCRGWDVGGRVDLVYGTDWRFTRSNGLEDDWNESERFYGLAFPQAYVDLAVGYVNVRAGHFYTIIGYEVVPAPENFFYSHAYTMQYGEPFTHTGVLSTVQLCDWLSVSGGMHRGWDNWEDNNDKLSYLGGITVKSDDDRASLALAVSTGPYDDDGDLNRTMYSVVYSNRITDRLTYVFQHDWGLDNDGGPTYVSRDQQVVASDAKWFGINQYVTLQINPCLAVGVRAEWFRDEDGTRVGGIGYPNGWDLGPGWAGDFYALTLGLNWKPMSNVVLRPECRWDWYDGDTTPTGELPYDSGEADDQFTMAVDAIVTF